MLNSMAWRINSDVHSSLSSREEYEGKEREQRTLHNHEQKFQSSD